MKLRSANCLFENAATEKRHPQTQWRRQSLESARPARSCLLCNLFAGQRVEGSFSSYNFPLRNAACAFVRKWPAATEYQKTRKGCPRGRNCARIEYGVPGHGNLQGQELLQCAMS